MTDLEESIVNINNLFKIKQEEIESIKRTLGDTELELSDTKRQLNDIKSKYVELNQKWESLMKTVSKEINKKGDD